MSSFPDSEIEKLLSTSKSNAFSKGFKVSCPQLHILDAKRSLNFYCNILGMKLLKKLDFPPGQFTDYFLGYVDSEEDSEIPPVRSNEEILWAMTKPRTIDLRHHWKRTTPYDIGDGFSNISLIVPFIHHACERLDKHNVTFLKRPDEGGLTGLALIKDPDGYTVELYTEQAIKDHCFTKSKD